MVHEPTKDQIIDEGDTSSQPRKKKIYENSSTHVEKERKQPRQH